MQVVGHILREPRDELLAIALGLEVDVLTAGLFEARLVPLILLIYIGRNELHTGRGCQVHLAVMIFIALILFGVISTLILFCSLSSIVVMDSHRVGIIATQATAHLVVDAKLGVR